MTLYADYIMLPAEMDISLRNNNSYFSGFVKGQPISSENLDITVTFSDGYSYTPDSEDIIIKGTNGEGNEITLSDKDTKLTVSCDCGQNTLSTDVDIEVFTPMIDPDGGEYDEPICWVRQPNLRYVGQEIPQNTDGYWFDNLAILMKGNKGTNDYWDTNDYYGKTSNALWSEGCYIMSDVKTLTASTKAVNFYMVDEWGNKVFLEKFTCSPIEPNSRSTNNKLCVGYKSGMLNDKNQIIIDTSCAYSQKLTTIPGYKLIVALPKTVVSGGKPVVMPSFKNETKSLSVSLGSGVKVELNTSTGNFSVWNGSTFSNEKFSVNFVNTNMAGSAVNYAIGQLKTQNYDYEISYEKVNTEFKF